MYIKKLIDKNVGPIVDAQIEFPFYENGNPKPVVLVGENGTGKSTILSNIVDSFFEMAGKAFNNANQPNERQGYQYYKTIASCEIHNEASYMYSVIYFLEEKNPHYLYKCGDIKFEDFRKQIGDNTTGFSWSEESSKDVFSDKKAITKIWENNVICYFGPDRYEKPVWMGNKYYQIEGYLHPAADPKWSGDIKNPIMVRNVTEVNLQWLMDVIVDSRADVVGNASSLRLDKHTDVNDLLLLKQARNNLETILSRIIGEDVSFQLNYRNGGNSRFRIVKKGDGGLVAPTLDSLSTGQVALFNLFATIVRYADKNNINKSIQLNEISGIVVVDEIELHLHSSLQKEVLPDLIKLFPKVQFIITSHAPLFLLGMRDVFGDDGFEVYEMPNAEKIDAEGFSEFIKAYDYLKETEKYREEAKKIAKMIPEGEKPLIITEGATDWKHMKIAYQELSQKEEYKHIFEGLDYDLLEFEPKNSTKPAAFKVEMGNESLISLCDSLSKLPNKRKHIIIADRDVERINQKLMTQKAAYKKWGNNTFSAILPVPQCRLATPNICIEHYYSNEEIEKEIEMDGVKRHLFMGKDFNSSGYNLNEDRFCERKDHCGEGKITIIDGTQGERVRKLSDDNDETNYALPKSDFAEYVCTHPDEFDFSNFIPLFELIKAIIEEE